MTSGSKHNFRETINHRQPDKVVVDFGSTSVTGIHVLIVEKLREYYGLEKKPVRVFEPYQMLGEIDDELIREMGIDVLGIFGENNMFGIRNTGWKVHKTPWGQEVMFPGEFNYSFSAGGDILIHPGGDTSVPPCAVMPRSGYFFDALNRQGPIDESALRVEDNLEEFTEISDHDLQYWKKQAESVSNAGKGIVASLGGTALGDIALVPGLQLKEPKGIRGVEEWYISTVMREDFVKEIFDRQSDIALKNLEKINNAAGNLIDVVFVCGTDFGTQNSTFCSPETFARVWMPYYQKINNWIHQNTGWKTFKHSCGSIDSLMELFIESGFDIINPVQINAAGMDPVMLKKNYGSRITFWGGGVDTQKTFPFGTAAQVKDQVKRQCDILNNDGGFVFNTVHNIQANVPFENVVAMLEALSGLNSK